MHSVLPYSPIALAAPSLVIGFGASSSQLIPGGLEAGAGAVEGFGDTIPMIARVNAG